MRGFAGAVVFCMSMDQREVLGLKLLTGRAAALAGGPRFNGVRGLPTVAGFAVAE